MTLSVKQKTVDGDNPYTVPTVLLDRAMALLEKYKAMAVELKAQRDAAQSVLWSIKEQEEVEMMLDPGWAKRLAAAYFVPPVDPENKV
jgi:hypothetical protein